jgi:hypothetical protein
VRQLIFHADQLSPAVPLEFRQLFSGGQGQLEGFAIRCATARTLTAYRGAAARFKIPLVFPGQMLIKNRRNSKDLLLLFCIVSYTIDFFLSLKNLHIKNMIRHQFRNQIRI